MFSTKSTKHPHTTRISSTLGKVFRLGLAVRVKVAGAQSKEALDKGSGSGSSDEKKDRVPDLVPEHEKLEDKAQIVVGEEHLPDGVVAVAATETLPLPLPLPYHPSQSQSDSTQETTDSPSPELEFQDAVEYQPPEYTPHRLSTVPEVDVEALKTPTNVDGESRYRLSTLVELEYYEPRAAYDFVDDEELDELDSPSSPSSPRQPSNSTTNRLSREVARDGEEDGDGGTTWDPEVPDDRIYEAHFRLTPCVEFEDCSEDGFEIEKVNGEGGRVEGVDKEAEAELEEAWLAVLEEQKVMAAVARKETEREEERLKQVVGARSTKEGHVGKKQLVEKEREGGGGGKEKDKAENKPMDLVKSEDSIPNIPSPSLSTSSPPTSNPPVPAPPSSEVEPNGDQVHQPIQIDVEEKEKAKVKEAVERDMTPEEEASLIAHWEKRRVVYERHATSLEHLLASNPSNKAWLQRSGLNVDELLRCLRWTPEGFEEVVQEVQALSASGSSSSSAGASSSGSGVGSGAGSASPLSGEKGGALLSGGTSSSDVTGLVGEGEGGTGVNEDGEEEEEKKAKHQARQKKLRELRSQHRRNTRKLLENTKKVDEMMAVLADLLRGMSEAAEKKRVERRKEKEREKERERERRRKAAEEVRKRAVAVKGKEREEEKERWTFVEKPSEAEKVKEKEKERQRTSTTTPTKVVSSPRSLTSTSPSSAKTTTSLVQPKAGPSRHSPPRAPVSTSSNSSQLPQPPSPPPPPPVPTKKRSLRNLLRPSASLGSTKSKSTKEKSASSPVSKKADSKSLAKSKKSKHTSPPTTVNNKRSPSVAASERTGTRRTTPASAMPPRLPPTPDYASSLGVNVDDWLAGQALLREEV